MIHALRDAFRAARVDVLAEKRNAGVYRVADGVSRIYRYDANPLSVLQRLRRSRYDAIIDTEQFHHFSLVLANALRPRVLCGFDSPARGRLQTHSVAYGDDVYEGRSFLRLAEALVGAPIPFDPEAPFVEVVAGARAWAERALEPVGGRELIAVSPAAGGPYRLWPAARYAEVIQALIDRGDCVVLLGGRDGLEAAKQIVAGCGSSGLLDLTGQTTLAQTAAVLRRARLCLSADTGVMHLAYGVGTATLSLFGPGRHQKWAPPGRRHRVVRRGLSCSPCTRLGRVPACPYDVACMREISADEVSVAIEEALRG